jgi:hypothetical protein
MGSRTRATIALCAALAWAPAAVAQDATVEAARRELISHAEHASDRGDHAHAVELLTRAAAVRASTSLRQFLADELALSGNWLRAYTEAVQCEREATADRHLRDRRDILRDCARISSRARPHLGQLVVTAPDDVASLRVRVAGVEVPRALWGVAFPVAAGDTAVEASADDGRTFRESVTVAEGQERALRVVLPPIAPHVAQVAPAPPAARVAAPLTLQRGTAPVRLVAPAPRGRPAQPLRAVAWSALGLGVVGLGVGVAATVLTGDAADTFNATGACGEAEPSRGGDGCQSAYDRVTTLHAIAVTGWIVGGVGAVAGAVLLAIPGRAASSARGMTSSWWLASGPGDVGASVGARF